MNFGRCMIRECKNCRYETSCFKEYDNADMTVIGGHQRLKVLKELGYKEVECNIVDLDKTKENAIQWN